MYFSQFLGLTAGAKVKVNEKLPNTSLHGTEGTVTWFTFASYIIPVVFEGENNNVRFIHYENLDLVGSR